MIGVGCWFRWTSWLPQVPGESEHLCRLCYPLVSLGSSEIRIPDVPKNKKGSTKAELALLMTLWLVDLKEIVVLLAWIGWLVLGWGGPQCSESLWVLLGWVKGQHCPFRLSGSNDTSVDEPKPRGA